MGKTGQEVNSAKNTDRRQMVNGLLKRQN